MRNFLYRLWLVRKYKRLVRKTGFQLTSLELLPKGSDDFCRVTPLDGFAHDGDDCVCKPIQSDIPRKGGGSFTVIRHRRMELYEVSQVWGPKSES